MDKFNQLETFVAVIESGSFSAAGERLNVAKSMVSRRITEFEKRLGVRLLHRTTRRLHVTDAGRNMYQRALQILADVNEAEQCVTQDVTELRGMIRLAAPLSFGLNYLTDALAEFLTANPAIELQLDLNDRNINLVEEGFDMAVRIGTLADSTMTARRLTTSQHFTCASDLYLQEHGIPKHPDDLKQHIGLQYSNISYQQQWQYQTTTGEILYGQPHIRMSANNGEALAIAAIAHLGIVASPAFIINKYLESGQLTHILSAYQCSTLGIYAVYPPGRLTPKRIQALSDFLAHHFTTILL